MPVSIPIHWHRPVPAPRPARPPMIVVGGETQAVLDGRRGAKGQNNRHGAS